MAVGLGVAAELISPKEYDDLLHKRELFVQKLRTKLDFIKVNFENSPRLPNTASICFTGFDAGLILQNLEGKIEASRSAACHSGTGTSNVLVKSGLSLADAASTIRFSVGRNTTDEEIEKASECIFDAISKIKQS